MDDEKERMDSNSCTSFLTHDFTPVRGDSTVAELRPPQDDPLSFEALAPLLRVSPRTAQRLIARWMVRGETNPTLPRVVRVQTGGRPGHRVERESFERWRRRFDPRGVEQ